MKKQMWKRVACLALAGVMLASSGMAVFADNNITVSDTDKPYVSFGADLNADQKETVIELMGLNASDENNWTVSTVTNSEEHQYLDSYIPSSEIGTRALSSVVVLERESGNGIEVSTININYCTAGMYENALATAGLKDADVIVAAPTSISGTAALVGAIKAYSEMSGVEVSEENIDAAMNELVITGKIAENEGDSEDVENMIAYIKGEIADKDLNSEDDLNQIIDDASEKFQVELTEEERAQLIELLKKIAALNLDPAQLLEQAKGVYQKLQDMGIDFSDPATQQEALNIFQRLLNWLQGLFGN